MYNWQDEMNKTCKDAQKIVSKYGHYIVCPEDTVEKPSSDPMCENMKQIVSKYGYTIVCPE